MNKFRKKKEKMFAHDPHCRRCGVLMWLPPSGVGRLQKKLTEEQKNSMATIGHKFSKLDDRRMTASGYEKTYVLICSKCNQDEAFEENKKLSLEEQWERSKAYPQWHIMHIANQQNKHH